MSSQTAKLLSVADLQTLKGLTNYTMFKKNDVSHDKFSYWYLCQYKGTGSIL